LSSALDARANRALHRIINFIIHKANTIVVFLSVLENLAKRSYNLKLFLRANCKKLTALIRNVFDG
jgi:hypothetical protein